jgi:hypothetical protein
MEPIEIATVHAKLTQIAGRGHIRPFRYNHCAIMKTTRRNVSQQLPCLKALMQLTCLALPKNWTRLTSPGSL